jgi:predicted transposase YbfD/YdcC
MLPVEGDPDTFKQTNEIKIAAPLLEPLDIQDKDVTADALLTQRDFARFIRFKGGHYHFTVKGNQGNLLKDIERQFLRRDKPHFTDTCAGHGRIETRSIWVTEALNEYLDFPEVAQAFLIDREVVKKKTGELSRELAYGITSRPASEASPERLLQVNRGHWTIENRIHYVIDWNFDEDRSRIRTGYGPENVSRLRRFAVCLIQSKRGRKVAETLRLLNRNIRLVFDYLLMTKNARRTGPTPSAAQAASAAPA